MSKISIYEVAPVPKLADKLVGTSVGGDPEDITYNFTLSELLNLFIPNIPGNTLQGVLDFGNTATQDIILNGTIFTTYLEVTDTATILDSFLTGETHITGGLYDRLNSVGTAGQVLRSTGTQVEWYSVPTVIPDLQQVLTSGNTAVNNIILTGNLSANNAALLTSTISTSLTLLGTLRDGLSSVGANNQVLSSNVTGVRWVNLPVYSATSPLLYNSGTGVFSIQQANASQNGYLSSADWITFDGKQTSISLTTTGNSGASTLVGATINVPNYTLAGLGGVPQTRTLTINGVTYNLSADRSWTLATGVSSVSATTPLFSTGGVNPDISIQQSSSSLDGYLSSTDWLTFNSKQPAGNYITSLTGEATAAGPGAASVTLSNAAVIGKLLTGLSITGSAISSSDSILTAFGKVQNQINGLIGGVQFQGVWNAATNTPTLVSSVGTQGYYYIVDVAGNTNLNGITDWQVGDWAIFNGSTWNKVDNTDLVTSVNGQVGAVSLTTDNIPEGATNLYYLDSRARAALSFAAGSGAYNSTTGVITIPTDNSQILNGAGYITLVSLSATSPLSYNNTTGAFSIQVANTTQNGYLSSTDWNTFNGKQDYLNGTGLVKSVAGVISYITDNSANWNTAYNDSIVSASVTGTATKTLTLNQQDGGTITASWSDIDTGLTSVGVSMPSAFTVTNSPLTSNGTIAITGSGNTLQYVDGTGALQSFPSLTGYVPYTGATANVNLGIYNLTAASLIKNGGTSGQFLKADGSVDSSAYIVLGSLSATAPLSYNNTTGVFTISQSGASTNGYLSSTDWNTFNSKEPAITAGTTLQYYRGDKTFQTLNTTVVPEGTNLYYLDSRARTAISLTTTGSSGAATYNNTTGVFNIPDYGSALSGYVPTSRQLSINGTAYDLSADRSWSVGTVTAVAALTLGTTGTDLSSSVATGTTTPVITLNVPTASAANRGALSAADWSTFNTKVGGVTATTPLFSSGGSTPNLTIQQSSGSQAGYLSSTDWTTFNNKQAAGNYITSLTGEATATGPGAAAVTLDNASVTAKILTGVNITGGTVLSTDTMLTAFGKLQNQINGLIGGSIYQGTWNAATNTPTLTSGVGVQGYYYIVSVAGTTNLDGITDWFVGDWAIFNGGVWQQVDNTDAVVSVNGQTGAVSLTTDNIPEGTTNLYYTNTRARAALSFVAGSGAYNSSTGAITIPTNTSQLTNGANFITLTSLSATGPIVYTNTTGVISITQSSGSTNGFLSNTDWNTFNNKQSALTFTGPLVNTAGTVSITQSSGSTNGFLSNTDWNTFNNKQATITLTTTGTSGAATLVGATLNIPQYQSVITNPVTGTGTTNYVSKWTSSSAIGNSVIFDNGTNVGIGAGSSPNTNSRLTISDGTSISAYWRATNTNSATRDWCIITNNANFGDFSIRQGNSQGADATVGTDRLLILPSGNAQFSLPNSGNSVGTGNITLLSTATAVNDRLTINFAQTGIASRARAGIGSVAEESSGYAASLAFYTKSAIDGSALDTTNEKMRITSGGYVGIGTTTPANLLTLKASVVAPVIDINRSGGGQGKNSGILFRDQLNNEVGAIGTEGQETNDLQILSVGGIRFYTSSNLIITNERMRIFSDGNVGINTGATNAGFKLDVSGTARVTSLITGGGGIKISGGTPYVGGYTNDGLWGATATPNFISTTGNAGSSGGNAFLLGYDDNESGLYSPAYGFPVKSTDGNNTPNRVVRALVMRDTDKNTYPFIVYNNGFIESSTGATFGTLAGTGTRIVVADASGTLSASSALSGYITGSGTTNYVPKFTSGSAIGNSQIFDNGTNVGIGTATPATKLEVRTNSAGVAAARFSDSNYADLVIGFPTVGVASIDFEYGGAGALAFRSGTGKTQRMYLSAAGELSLNLSTGAGAFGNGINIITTAGTYSTGHGGILQFQNEDVITAGIRGVRDPGSWASSLLFYTHTSAVGNTFGTTFTEKARITDDGNLLVNTVTNAGYRLDVSGTGRFTGTISGGGNFELVNAGGPYVLVGEGTGVNQYAAIDWDATNNRLRIATQPYAFGANGGQITLTTGGLVGIGTTSPAYRLDVSGSSMTRGTLVIDNNGTDTSLTEYIRFERNSQGSANYFNSIYSSTGSGSNFMQFRLSNTSGSQGTVMTLTGTGNVGIGTINPATLLTVQSSGANGLLLDSNTSGSTSSSRLFMRNNADTFAFLVDTNGLNVLSGGTVGSSSGSPRMTITSGGNVGINTTFSGINTASLLTIKASVADGNQIYIVQSNDDRGWRMKAKTDGHFYLQAAYSSGNSDVLKACYDTGNVLIGTITDSGFKLNVNGTGNFSSMISGGGGLRVNGGNGNTSYTPDGLWGASATPNFVATTGYGGPYGNSLNNSGLLLGYADNGSGLYSPAYGFQVKSTDGAGVPNRVVVAIRIKDTDKNTYPLTIYNNGAIDTIGSITAAGTVCIGTTSPYGSNLLNVNGSVYATGNIAAVVAADVDLFTFVSTSASYTKSCFVGSIAAAGSTSSYYFYGQQSTSVVALKIFTNGNIQNTNNSYGAISDARLKENIIDATPKLEDLMKVKVRNYNLKGESNKQLGVISQELEEIFPNMIEESTNIGESVKIKGVKYSVFVPMLIKAIQEQQEQINYLKSKIQ